MLTAFYLVGGLILCFGLVLLIRGLRGRMVNDHPHCRGCGFDLSGINLSSPTNCPECGRLVSTSRASVRNGLRKRRNVTIFCGVLLLMLGTVGMSWTQIAKIPAIQKINWYEHLPEPMLISMAAHGSDKALDVLHARLIPGEVSDEGLESMVEHALSRMEDESAAWDERWGDVLLYAYLTDGLDEDQLIAYVRKSIKAELLFKDQMPTESTYLRFQRSIRRTDHGEASSRFSQRLIEHGLAEQGTYSLASQYTLTLERVLLKSGAEILMDSPRVSLMSGQSEPGWAPFLIGTNIGTGQGVEMPASEPVEEELTVEYQFLLEHPNGATVQWIASASKTLTRTATPVYADFVSDRADLENQLVDIQISSLLIPNDPEAIKASGQGGTHRGIFEIYNQSDSAIGFCGEVIFQVGDERLPFTTRYLDLSKTSGIGVHSVRKYSNRWWEHFIEHQAFWDQVEEQGVVDVIIVPDPEYAEGIVSLASTDRVFDQPVIFRSVPVEFYTVVTDEPWGRDSALSRAMSVRRDDEVGVQHTELYNEGERP